MKRIIVSVLILVSSGGCSRTEFGSNCSEDAITIVEQRDQESARSVVEPFIYTSEYGTRITIGRYDAYKLLAARARESTEVARSVALLRAVFDTLPRTGIATDAKSIHPDLNSLKGKQLDDGVLVVNELMIFFLRAIDTGSAGIEPNQSEPIVTVLQRYEAVVPGGTLRGTRAMVGTKRIYDYCGVWPKGT